MNPRSPVGAAISRPQTRADAPSPVGSDPQIAPPSCALHVLARPVRLASPERGLGCAQCAHWAEGSAVAIRVPRPPCHCEPVTVSLVWQSVSPVLGQRIRIATPNPSVTGASAVDTSPFRGGKAHRFAMTGFRPVRSAAAFPVLRRGGYQPPADIGV